MVRILVGFILFIFILNLAHARVSVYPKKVMLGLPITMIFNGKNIETDFEAVDKEALKKLFEIYDVDGDSDRIRLVLYPKKSGDLVMPPLKYGQINYAGELIKVVKNNEVNITWQRPVGRSFVNQVVAWKAEVKLSNSANKVTLEQHPHYNNKLFYELTAEPYKIEQGLLSDAKYFVMSITLNKAGNIKIRSPVIKVKNTTSRPWLFFDDTTKLFVSALPSYLPVATVVGELSIKIDDLPLFVRSGELHYFKTTVFGQNVPIDFLPKLSQQLYFQKGLEWLSPDITASTELNGQGSFNQLKIEQPFRANKAGLYSIPSMRLTYFDVEREQLKDVFTEQQFFVSVPTWFLWLLNAVKYLVLMAIALIFVVFGWQFVLKVRLIKQLKQAPSNIEIWQACQAWSKQFLFLTENNSIGQWQAEIENNLGGSDELSNLIKQLNQESYSDIAVINLRLSARQWAMKLPYFSIKLFFILLIKWQNNLAVFIKRNH